jgi:tetratricopeptide (TPR) repeat protein
VELEAATTPSLRALELYSKGMQEMYALRFTEAEALFRQAAEEDPRFASAHLLVFWALNNQEPWRRSENEMRRYLERAMELADTASEQERYFIEGSYYQYAERNYEKACASYGLLAGLFPGHYWAAFNAAHVCGEVLGRREEYVRYLVQAAEQRLEAKVLAAAALTLVEGDFVRARPYVEQLKVLGAMENGIPPGWKGWALAFNELFAAEEFLAKGLLPEVVRELERVEGVLASTESAPVRELLTWKLVKFYLALGQHRKALDLGNKASTWSILPGWLAYLTDDRAAFLEHNQAFLAQYQTVMPDPARRAAVYLSRNMTWWMEGFPIFVLVPMYEPESAVALASTAVLDESSGEFSTEFLHWPALEAKLQLARGIEMLNQGRLQDAMAPLESGLGWFGEYGGWEKYCYFFVGAEVLAVVLTGQGHLEAAYRVLNGVAMNKKMVNSYSAPLHQRLQARLALLSRELGRRDEAEAIEAELSNALMFADPDHPILVQIRDRQDPHLDLE